MWHKGNAETGEIEEIEVLGSSAGFVTVANPDGEEGDKVKRVKKTSRTCVIRESKAECAKAIASALQLQYELAKDAVAKARDVEADASRQLQSFVKSNEELLRCDDPGEPEEVSE